MRLSRAQLVAVLVVLGTVAAVATAALVAVRSSRPDSPGEIALGLPLPPPRSGGDVSDYRGLGAWIDIYDSSWSSPFQEVEAMKARGVRTLYLQTSNYNRHHPFVFREKVEMFLDAAEAFDMQTVAWYLPGLRDMKIDLERSIAAIQLETAEGNAFDSFALDIESPEVRDPGRRSTRLLRLSARLRAAAGDTYPLGAIIPSPRGLEYHPTYWPDFPYAELTSFYDVILPMTYFTWRVQGPQGAHWYTEQSIKIIRERSGDPSFPIHVIGGIANEATTPETRGFVRAVRERGVLGASFYTFPLTQTGQWPSLGTLPANPVQSPSLPARLRTADELGNVPGGDRSHPKEVFYATGGRAGDWTLEFDAFDVQRGEVRVLVNWKALGTISAGEADRWTGRLSLPVDGSLLRDEGSNVIGFVAEGDDPNWSTWGVRSVDLLPAG